MLDKSASREEIMKETCSTVDKFAHFFPSCCNFLIQARRSWKLLHVSHLHTSGVIITCVSLFIM